MTKPNMKSKSECWANFIGSFILIILLYIIIYKSPNFEEIKIIIPLLGALAGWMMHKSAAEYPK